MRTWARNQRLGWAATALATLAICPAGAQDTGSQMTRAFVDAAAQSDEFEQLEATTALAQSQNSNVRAFATEMLNAHAETRRALLAAVAKAGVMSPPPGISGDQSSLLAALQSARGADFDKQYAKQQVLAHRAALVTGQAYAMAGDVPAIRTVAVMTTHVIRSHLQIADALVARMGNP